MGEICDPLFGRGISAPLQINPCTNVHIQYTKYTRNLHNVFYLPYSLKPPEVKIVFSVRFGVGEFKWIILRKKLKMSFNGVKPIKPKDNLRFKAFSDGFMFLSSRGGGGDE